MVVPGENLYYMKKRIVDLITQPELRHQLGSRGPQAIRAMSDKAGFTAQIEDTVLRLLRAQPEMS